MKQKRQKALEEIKQELIEKINYEANLILEESDIEVPLKIDKELVDDQKILDLTEDLEIELSVKPNKDPSKLEFFFTKDSLIDFYDESIEKINPKELSIGLLHEILYQLEKINEDVI